MNENEESKSVYNYGRNSGYTDGFVGGYKAGENDAKPKKGQWIRNDNGTYSCSVCQSWIPEEQHCYARYCLYCGAKMEVTE